MKTTNENIKKAGYHDVVSVTDINVLRQKGCYVVEAY